VAVPIIFTIWKKELSSFNPADVLADEFFTKVLFFKT
jgi:hypothetical protein